ncbi:hypothetical protein LTR64_008629 [Lithohypha guttulata]|uniref:uncharacterized protein n=1 Tax=Lithohypha guttulata TaxID=1690604 RepID=UPI00315CD221
MSYYRVTAHLYIFLVDAPVSCLDGGPGCASMPSLSFPYGIDGCHLKLPYYGPGIPNLYSILQYMSLSAWTYEYLFTKFSGCICPGLLFHVMSAVAIHVDLQGTTVHVQHLSAIEMNNDTILMPDSLPAIRVGLMTTRTTIDYTIANAHPHFRPALEAQIHGRESIVQRLERHAISVRDLDQFAVQTIQLYANLITIRHGKLNVEQARESLEQSKAAVKQAKQGIFLTRLAAVYLPLSLATGIFGMNTKEINPEAIPNWKVAVVTATILLTITIIITVAGGAWGASFSWLRWIPRLIKSCRQRKDRDSSMSSIPPRSPTPPSYDKKARFATKAVWELAP